jgi:hypothetical protein
MAAAALLAALAGCLMPVRERIYSRCAVLGSSNWSARHFAVAGGGSAVAVSGTVTLPTGGYRLALEPGPLLDLNPPVQQVILRTRPPVGNATQAVTEQTVSVGLRLQEKAQALSVRCGDGVIAEIAAIAPATE